MDSGTLTKCIKCADDVAFGPEIVVVKLALFEAVHVCDSLEKARLNYSRVLDL